MLVGPDLLQQGPGQGNRGLALLEGRGTGARLFEVAPLPQVARPNEDPQRRVLARGVRNAFAVWCKQVSGATVENDPE